MKKTKSAVLVGILILTLGGCLSDDDSNLDAPRKFFEKHKIGSSTDWGIIKWNNPYADHVITVHGFLDDRETCITIADALNEDACKETDGEGCLNPFSCQPLNH
jgi:hypothetical protein